MGELNDETIATYRENFDKYAERTPSTVKDEFALWLDMFIHTLPKNPKILELGSATGRDAMYLQERGAHIHCTDVIPEALEKLSQKGFETSQYDFRDAPAQSWLDTYDGVLANAVLLHANPDQLEQAFTNIHAILKSDGLLAFSLKEGSGQATTTVKMEAPRTFYYYTQDQVESMLAKHHFSVMYKNIITSEIKESWLHFIARRIELEP